MHFQWLALAIARYFSNSEMEEVDGLVRSEDVWSKGFVWKGVHVRVCRLGSLEFAEAKKEAGAIRKLSGVLASSGKYALPIVAVVRYEMKTLIVTPCITVNPEWKKDPVGYSATYSLDYADRFPNASKLAAEDLLLLDGLQYPKFIIARPQKLLNVSELSCLLYVPPEEAAHMEILQKVVSNVCEGQALASFLHKDGKTLEDVDVGSRFAYGWYTQMCCSRLGGEENKRLKQLFGEGKGLGLVACAYSKPCGAPVERVAEIAEELQVKAAQLNSVSLKDFLHRRGLSLKHSWILLSYQSNSAARTLLRIDILVRCMQKAMGEDAQAFKGALIAHANALLKQQPSDSVVEALFFSRLRVLVTPLNFMADKNRSYLTSEKIFYDTIRSASKNPAAFLKAIESLFNIAFAANTIKAAQDDRHKFLGKELPLKETDVTAVNIKADISVAPANCSYFAFMQAGHLNATGSRPVEVKPLSDELWTPWPSCSERAAGVGWLGTMQGKDALEKWLEYNMQTLYGLHLHDCLVLHSKALLDAAKAKKHPAACAEEFGKNVEEIGKCEIVVPELLIFCHTLAGVCYECRNNGMEAKYNYMCAFQAYLQLYGDPKGRGNCTHPWGIFLTYRLKALASKRTPDCSFMSELFEIIKHPYTNEPNQSIIAPFAEDIPLMLKDSLNQVWFSWLLYYSPMQHPSGSLWPQKEVDNVASYIKSRVDSKLPHAQTFLNEANQKREGVVYVWGGNDKGQLAVATSTREGQENPQLCIGLKDKVARKVVCGRNSSFAITVHSSVYAWGSNEFGQLGLGREAPKIVAKPMRIRGLPVDVIDIASGTEHTLALCDSGEVFSWGSNSGGLLGQGDSEATHAPKQIDNLKEVHKVACGGLHSVALTRGGQIFGWGRAEGGQLGIPEENLLLLVQQKGDCYVDAPLRVAGLGDIVDVSCGEAHTLALDSKGRVYGWGFCNFGQLGINQTSDSFEPGTGNYKSKVNTPRLIKLLTGLNVAKVIAGSTFSVFITAAGSIYSCGMNDFGQTGLKTCLRDLEVFYPSADKCVKTSDVAVPLGVNSFGGAKIREVVCGESHVLGVSTGPGDLWSWGKNEQGQLGLGEMGKVGEPRFVPEFHSVPLASVFVILEH